MRRKTLNNRKLKKKVFKFALPVATVAFITGFLVKPGLSGNSWPNSEIENKAVNETVIESQGSDNKDEKDESSQYYTLENIPDYNGSNYIEINNNIPFFTEEEKKSEEAFEYYSEMDELGRCKTAYANICREIMPTEERGKIGQIRPSGWHTVKYDTVEGKYLYNRCHLIAYQLAGENANEKNLITGTRYFNTQGMLPFENKVAEYVRDTGNHVLYRVTPVFEKDNLLAKGVEIEAYSVEDKGKGICFNVFVYNIQPGIYINYENGDSRQED